MTFFDLLRREWKKACSWNSPFLYLMVGVPIIYTLLFGFIYEQGVVNHMPLVICDQDNSSVSRAIITAYDSSERFALVAQVQTIDEMTNLIKEGRALSGIYIPPHFSQDIKSKVPTNIGVIVDGTNLVYSNGQLPVHSELTTSILVGISSGMAEGLNMPPEKAMNMVYPVHLDMRILSNPTNSYINFMLLGLVANALQIGIFLTASTLLCIEYRRIKKWCHVSSFSLFTVRYVGTFLVGLLTAGLVFLISHTIFDVPLRASFFSFFVLTSAFIFLFTSICFFFSALLPTPVLACQIPMIYVMPGLLYSGMSWPYDWMGIWAKRFSDIMPLTYYGEPLRDLSLRGYAVHLWTDVLHMVIGGVICLVLGYIIFVFQRKRFEKKSIAFSETSSKEVMSHE